MARSRKMGSSFFGEVYKEGFYVPPVEVHCRPLVRDMRSGWNNSSGLLDGDLAISIVGKLSRLPKAVFLFPLHRCLTAC